MHEPGREVVACGRPLCAPQPHPVCGVPQLCDSQPAEDTLQTQSSEHPELQWAWLTPGPRGLGKQFGGPEPYGGERPTPRRMRDGLQRTSLPAPHRLSILGSRSSAVRDDLAESLRADRRSRHRRALVAGLVATSVLGAGLAGGLALAPRSPSQTAIGPHASVSASATAPGGAAARHCRDTLVADRHYAGYTRDEPDGVGLGSTGPAVAEVQCLLLRSRMDSGDAVGRFGPGTQAAVKVFQGARHLKPSGVVDKDTWLQLRR